jgi:AcrR family transcriptional regulator
LTAPTSPADRRLTRQGEDRKADLLRHAEALFAKRGYADTRMIDIAHSAGVAKGLFYWYFDSKEGLFREIILDLQERLRVAQYEAVRVTDDPLSQLYLGTVETVRFIAKHHRLYGMFRHVSADPSLGDAVVQSNSTHAHDTAVVLREGQKRGLMQADEDPLALAYGNAGVVNSYVFMYRTTRPRPDLDQVAHLAARYVVRALAANDAAADRVIATYAP